MFHLAGDILPWMAAALALGAVIGWITSSPWHRAQFSASRIPVAIISAGAIVPVVLGLQVGHAGSRLGTALTLLAAYSIGCVAVVFARGRSGGRTG